MVAADGVSKIYKTGEINITALRNVNLKIWRGEYVAILGPSGSGKSTLLNIIGGLDRPTSGKIYVDGVDLGSLKEGRLARFRAEKVGFVFQFFNLIPTFTALENVMVPAEIVGLKAKDARRRAEKILVRVGLEGRFNHFPHQLSGGEQQRVAIARALVNNPPLLLCDEPTGNLDTKTGAEIIELLSEINTEYKATLIIVTHDQRIAKAADRIVNLVDGQILEE
ncbi:MAG: ABC transporter ATP-binding protein [Candidatus Bathyarchaeota archaeon]|nr:ABC transporter ATP-binding protein [Candidatus Bathyarchaeota archaeon]